LREEREMDMHRIDYKAISTEEELTAVRKAHPALDQACELCVGAETWGIIYEGGQRGQMSRWPTSRGAICLGGDSLWGDWYGDQLRIDDGLTIYNEDGEEI
jgi:hypothetical protein